MKAINTKAFIDRDLIQMRNGARMTDAATTSREPRRATARRASCGLRRPMLPAVAARGSCGSTRVSWAPWTAAALGPTAFPCAASGMSSERAPRDERINVSAGTRESGPAKQEKL